MQKDIRQLTDTLLNLNVGPTTQQPRPHKPLLVLYLLNRYWTRGETTYAYSDARPVLVNLLDAMPEVNEAKPRLPWWRLQTDGGIWQIAHRDDLTADKSGDVTDTALMQPRHSGAWAPWAAQAIRGAGALPLIDAVTVRYFPDRRAAQIRSILGIA